ncbi:GFA family protein [Kordiimonas aestuarii]|uniref:GFA family protein n=1 Tax=Kordiimonas aestuarii TaxID=1005925 RepID=UPI0021D259E6|nr:GFA family protein [Kordiimonas aestuarii]
MVKSNTDLRTGGCLCGHVRYEINMEGSRTGNCHCRDCQKNGGGPFMTFTTPQTGHLRWISEPEGRAQASDYAMRRFCVRCGTPMTWEHLSKDDMAVSTGTLDDPVDVTILYEIYTTSRWAGIPAIPGIRQYPRGTASD